MKNKIFIFIHKNKYFIQFIYGLIILNVIALILESYQELQVEFRNIFYWFEVFSVIIFTIEYLFRLWVSDLEPKYEGSNVMKRFKFATSTLGLIDIFAILPFYLPMIFPFDLRMIRILRLFRLLRIFKLGRYSKSLQTINNVFKETKAELTITFFVAFVLLVLSSTLMFYIEGDAQPEKFSNIGNAFWWSIATLTTVGYGDVYPITAMGKVLSAFIALIGIGFIALPTGIISSAFIDKIHENRTKDEDKKCKCPKCGTKF